MDGSILYLAKRNSSKSTMSDHPNENPVSSEDKFVGKCYRIFLMYVGLFADVGLPKSFEYVYVTYISFVMLLVCYLARKTIVETEDVGVKFSSATSYISAFLGASFVFYTRRIRTELLQSRDEINNVVRGFKDERTVAAIGRRCSNYVLCSIITITAMVLCYHTTPLALLLWSGFDFGNPYCLIIPGAYFWKPRGAVTYAVAYVSQFLILAPVSIEAILGTSVIMGFVVMPTTLYFELLEDMLISLQDDMTRNWRHNELEARLKNIVKAYQYVRGTLNFNEKLIVCEMELSFVGYIMIMVTSIIALLSGNEMAKILSCISIPILIFIFLVFCVLAEKFINFNERLIKKLYDLNWYEMRKEEKHILTIFMSQLQQPLEFKIFGIYIFSHNFFARVTNKVYSITLNILKMRQE